MAKLFAVMGKSAAGKDSVFRELSHSKKLLLKTVIPYTTRPIRKEEKNGTEYFFTDEERLRELMEGGRVIEHRAYDTVHGIWHYFTVDDGQIDLEHFSYIVITTPEGYEKLRGHYGPEAVIPVYIAVEDGLRLQRALDREKQQEVPGYAEMCRRYLADEKDFSSDHLEELGIARFYDNEDLEDCIQKITDDILSCL